MHIQIFIQNFLGREKVKLNDQTRTLYPAIAAGEAGNTETGLLEGALTWCDKVGDRVKDENGVSKYEAYSGYLDAKNSENTIWAHAIWEQLAPGTSGMYRKNLGINNAPAGMLSNSSGYFTATRCCVHSNNNTIAQWGLIWAKAFTFNGSLFGSTGTPGVMTYGVCPIVEMPKTNIKLFKDTASTTSKTIWNIETN